MSPGYTMLAKGFATAGEHGMDDSVQPIGCENPLPGKADLPLRNQPATHSAFVGKLNVDKRR